MGLWEIFDYETALLGLMLGASVNSACAATNRSAAHAPELRTPVRHIAISGRFPIRAIAFSPDGRYAAAGAEYASKIFIWNVNTGRMALQISTDEDVKGSEPESGGVARLVWSPDGAALASCDDRGRIDLWQTRLGSHH